MQGVFVYKAPLDHIYDQFQLGHMNWENWYSAIYKRGNKRVQLFCPVKERLADLIELRVGKRDCGMYEIEEWFNGFDSSCSKFYIVDCIIPFLGDFPHEYRERFNEINESIHKIDRIHIDDNYKDFPIKANEIIDVVNAIIDVFNLDVTVDVDCTDIENVKLLKAMWEANKNGTE